MKTKICNDCGKEYDEEDVHALSFIELETKNYLCINCIKDRHILWEDHSDNTNKICDICGKEHKINRILVVLFPDNVVRFLCKDCNNIFLIIPWLKE